MNIFKTPLAQRIQAYQDAEETARIQKMKEDKIQREKVYQQQYEMLEDIRRLASQLPIKEGEPYVMIPFSEHPAAAYAADHQMRFSVAAANFIFRDLNLANKHLKNSHPDIAIGYDKTDFVIYENGKSVYSGRYDIGSENGSLIAHMVEYFENYKKRSAGTKEIIRTDAFLQRLKKMATSFGF